MKVTELGAPVVAQATSGDEAAFAAIVSAHHDDMARVAFVVCRDAHMAQEAVHAAWTLAWRKLPAMRDPTKLRPWLMAIAANEARSLARRRRRRALREIAVDPLVDDNRVAVGADPAERVAIIDLANVLADLNLDDRAIVGMRYGAGMSSAEIGSAIGMSAGGVRARIARLLARLREDLGDE